MNKMNPEVDVFFSKAKGWQEEYSKLRTIVLDCALLFVKGALLHDAKGLRE